MPPRSDSYAGNFETLAPALRAWAVLRCRGPLGLAIDADDLFQEVALEGYRAFERFDPAHGEFRPWLFGVASRVAASALRRSARRNAVAGTGQLESLEHEPPAEVTTISRRVRRDEALTAFIRKVVELDDIDRGLLLHRGLEGLEHAQVGELVGLTTEGASKRWQRLRDRLRELPQARDLLGER
ncbi:RNA polymerase sigma factor [Engelhardtia mirabilis]|uniref:ECF RNA polymerase sigma factor SigG n=1 Tax=Engelhardtia mirabilis TaxID=2528011 RepID=A0A518BDL0_9BACT|nr:ECF RNA polymerase sigma factor SigG [Planctomycetes bacterium Pla133]QDU99358.1 ECF RNA polymerase sigma factor SigG [Planctomycetes bacterium Pla86]